MKLIKASEISARILTLLDESEERVVIVSPYIKISKWYKLLNKINELKSRGIPLEIYVRKDSGNTATYDDLDQVGLAYKKVAHLHSKLYLNERCGIVTSMNLLLNSEINSIEIGYITENESDYRDLWGYFERRIRIGDTMHYEAISRERGESFKSFVTNLKEELREHKLNTWASFASNALEISTARDDFIATINEGILKIKTELRINSRLNPSGKSKNAVGKGNNSVQPSSQLIQKIGDITAMDIEVQTGRLDANSAKVKPDPQFVQITGRARHTLKSLCISRIMETEESYVLESIRKFILTIEDQISEEMK